MKRCLGVVAVALVVLAVSGTPSAAQSVPSAAPTTELPPMDIIGSSPLLGSGVSRDQVPAQTNVLNNQQIVRTGIPQAARALEANVPGVNLSDASGNPNQPNLFYHGFEASSLQGTPQGIAVYLNGVRFNQAFGDTVHWDLIPDIAIDTMNLVGSNPVFGLNALGGALSVQMKNGFTYQGSEFSVFGGSFGQAGVNGQYGAKSENTSTYVAGTIQHQGGWRDLQSSDLYQVYGDIGWRSDRAEVHLNIAAADTQLNGPGTSPVELLSADRAAQFTSPNLVASKYTLVSLNGNWDLTDATSLQGVAYYDYFQQRVNNGNVSNFGTCPDGSGFLCDSSGNFAINRQGNPIPDFLNGGPYSELAQQTTNTNGYGASLQVTNRTPIFDHPNQFIAGLSYDGARTTFDASGAIGGLTLDTRAFVGPGIVVDQPDGSDTPVRVDTTSAYYGAFFTDTYALTPTVALNVAGRFNSAQIGLVDQNGSTLTGVHAYNHFNPGVGATWKALPWMSLYASYSVANRAPTPAELSCSSPQSPCSLANFFVGDPNLDQVVAHTVEAGVRGVGLPVLGGKLDWNVGVYHSDLDNDILFVNSPVLGRAYFTNVGSTLRQGVDVGARYGNERLSAWANFAYVDATFRSSFIESSQDNPAADAAGNITVRPGNRLPGIPPYQFKAGIDYRVTGDWTVGANLVVASSQFLFGDEANLTQKLPAYAVLNLTTKYQVTKNIQLFANVQNVTNSQYYTYGTFSPTSSVFLVQAPGATNPRSYSPAAPVGAYGGVRVTF